MRVLGVVAVLLGVAVLGFIASEAIRTSALVPPTPLVGQEGVIALHRLVAWATFIGLVALAVLVSGLGDIIMSRREKSFSPNPTTTNGETAAMIEAEVNEGGPPSPIPCDAPAEGKPCEQTHQFVGETPLAIETCPASDRILHLPLGKTVADAKSATLMKSDGLELIRLVIPAGKEISPHRAPGEITVHCIEGLVAFEHDGHALELQPGDVLHLCPQETHALKGIKNSSVLVTRLRPHATELPEKFPTS